MKRLILLLALVLAVAIGFRLSSAPPEVGAQDSLSQVRATPAAPAAAAQMKEPSVAPAQDDAVVIPTFFPKAKVIAKVADPVDSRGRQRVIETVETSMKEPYVRVERTFRRSEAGKRRQVGGEVAMVANQLLLEKPDSVDKEAFETMLHKAGALGVAEIGEEAYLATFAADPTDPRALDTFMSRVKEVAGADVIVEPNYIRKMF